jgi:hypothetical protein
MEEADDRSLLCITRNCRELSHDYIDEKFFQNSADLAVSQCYPILMKKLCETWNPEINELLLQLFEEEGE